MKNPLGKFILAVLALASSASAQSTLYWFGSDDIIGGSGNWTTTDTSWSASVTSPTTSPVAWTQNAIAVFQTNPGTATITTPPAIEVDTVRTLVGGVNLFGNATLTLTGNATFDATTAVTTIGDNVILAGTAGFTKTGANGILNFTNTVAASTITGPISIQAGEVNIANAGITPLGSGNSLSISSGARLTTSANQTFSSLTGAGTYRTDNSFTNVALTIAGTSGTSTFSGNITNIAAIQFALTKNGTSTQVLSGANRFRRVTVNAGTLQLASLNSLNSDGTVVMGNNSGAGTTTITSTNFTVASGATAAVNVGGTGEFSATNVNTLLANAGTGFAAGSAIGLDTTNATGGNFAYSNDLGVGQVAKGVTKLGTESLTLSGTNTYTGNTTVDAGSLLVDGSLAAGSTVNVNNGGTLGGVGTIGGTVNVNSGATLAPGNSPGVLTLGSLVLNSGSTTELEIDGTARGTGYDGINVTTAGGLTFGGDLKLTFTTTIANGTTLDLFSSTGTSLGDFAGISSSGLGYGGTWTNAGAGIWTFNSVPNNQTLTFSELNGDLSFDPIPEPSTWALVGLGLSAVLFLRRRRMSV